MDIRVLSYNVRGVTKLKAQRALSSFLKRSCFDILFLQETKVHDADWAYIGKQIWRDGTFYISPAAPGLHAARNSATVSGLGGLATAISSQLAPLVSYHYNTICGRATLLHIDDLSSGSLGIINVYVPNDELE
jgi:exonuclease III